MPSSLNCPNCGAPAAGTDASRCAYCGSTLTSMACPSCFGTMFVGMQFCPHCGAKAARVLGDATLPCPGCRGEMRAVQIGTTPVFECASCSSTWLDAGTFTQLCTSREQRGFIASMVGPKQVSVVPAAPTPVRYVPCPICKKVLNRENFGRRSGVIIDVCKADGVWFERGELQTCMAFIDSGGLERARIQELERQLAERAALQQAHIELTRDNPFHSTSVFSLNIEVTKTGSAAVTDALAKLFS
jgi:Zn-finger nucleic acid-binding protein